MYFIMFIYVYRKNVGEGEAVSSRSIWFDRTTPPPASAPEKLSRNSAGKNSSHLSCVTSKYIVITGAPSRFSNV